MAFSRNPKFGASKSSSKVDEAKLSQMIRERAYYIWESKGKPKGQDAAIWFQAEKEMRAKYR
ncbi:MAG: DUF2934 domain-containing protein [Candidatus Omnitrophica bacterium]|nr:DUF2934 domain-containing protein [Candidatus Omnitrophota bacterium]